MPRGRVLKDEVVGDLAVQAPTTMEKLAGLRSLPKGFERSKWGHDILEAVKRGLARDPKSLPHLERSQQTMNGTATVELLKVLLRMTAERNGVAAKVIATVDDLEQIAGERRGRRAGAEGLAARNVRREGDRAQARAARARGREAPRGRGGALANYSLRHRKLFGCGGHELMTRILGKDHRHVGRRHLDPHHADPDGRAAQHADARNLRATR